MPTVTRPYDPGIGPVIEVTISDPVSLRDDEQPPKSEKVIMLLDSGASECSISPAVAARLQLVPHGLHEIIGVAASRQAHHQYMADLGLWLGNDCVEYFDWQLIEFSARYDKIDGLLGRDILAHANFHLDGPNRRFTLTIDR